MIIKKVDKIKQRYLELIKLIDSGEYRVANGEIEGFSHWLELYTFDMENNLGVLTSLIHNDKLRFQIAFKKDICDNDVEVIYNLIKRIMTSKNLDADIWIYNDNHNLVKILMEKFNILRKNVYMSREVMYFKKPLKMDISPLKVVPYKEEILMDILLLLESAFVNIAQPNDFLNHKEYYNKKFSNKDKSRFEGFLLNDELIGMYFHHDAEIEYIAVKPEYQSNGYGKMIIHDALNKIKQDSDNIPYLYCVDENVEALKFYLREGFEAVGHAARLCVHK